MIPTGSDTIRKETEKETETETETETEPVARAGAMPWGGEERP